MKAGGGRAWIGLGPAGRYCVGGPAGGPLGGALIGRFLQTGPSGPVRQPASIQMALAWDTTTFARQAGGPLTLSGGGGGVRGAGA